MLLRLHQRRLVAALALLTAACAGDAATPTADDTDAMAVMASQGYDATASAKAPLAPLPPDLALTAEQRARIDALVATFEQANAADLEAVRKADADAMALVRAGRPRAEVQAVLEGSRAARERIRAARQALQVAIEGVLTPEQRARLRPQPPAGCMPPSAPPRLAPEQAQRLRAAQQQLMAATRADHELVRQAMQRADSARRAGATPEQVRDILASARDAQERIRQAVEAFRAATPFLPPPPAPGCTPGPQPPVPPRG
ncbi:MAG: Spy/CpxP family protein refolding chaperone [Gemmatimonadales bacterium]|nr:Spy/CpxP family protein refolding chaperone [Gemmatimonadales bacterium]